MKIAAFNLRHGGKTSVNNSWTQIFTKFAPDIVLAQETFHPKEYLSAGDLAGCGGPAGACVPRRKWGSAVYSARRPLVPVSIPGFDGWITGAHIPTLRIGRSDKELLVFSLHAPSPYASKVNSILDAISSLRGECDLILGGDFNITTAIRHSSETIQSGASDRQILKRLRTEFGLVNAWQALHPNESLPQTLRWSGNLTTAYHCDGIFVPFSCVPYLVDVVIGDMDTWASWSDHNPIVATFRDE